MASSLNIDPQGASIRSLVLKDKEILWSGIRPDNGKGITHPCIPNFNIATGLPNHGPARKKEWKKENETTYSWVMQAVGDVYPAGLTATRTFVLENDALTVTTTITNDSSQDLPINIAEHNYFFCSPDKRGEVKINGVLFDSGALEGNAKCLPISGEEVKIEIPDKHVILLTVDGYTAFTQWSQPNAEFVCVEPLQVAPPEPEKFMSNAPKIKAGEEKKFWYRIAVEA